jgi:hypothetical protein
MVTLDRAWCVLCALTARKPAHDHGHGHGQKAEKNEFWRKLRHKSDCCCFGWAVYAPWACYVNLRALYVSKLAKCPLTCLADLAGDLPFASRKNASFETSYSNSRVIFFGRPLLGLGVRRPWSLSS